MLVDTNIFIDLMKGDKNISLKLESHTDVYISPHILAELYFGAYRSDNPHKNIDRVNRILQRTIFLAVDANTAEIFVTIKLNLYIKGKPIPENDIWIAATAIRHKIPLYTADKHFSEVTGLDLA